MASFHKQLLTLSFVLLIPSSLQHSNATRLNSVQISKDCNPKLISWGTLQLRRPKPNVTRITGAVDLLQNIGTQYTLVTHVHVNGRTLRVIDEDVCSTMRDQHPTWWLEFQPRKLDCPIRKGRYQVLNLQIAEHMFYGLANNYTMDVQLRRGMGTVCKVIVEMSYSPPPGTPKLKT